MSNSDLSIPKNRDVKIEIDITLLGWLASITKMSPKNIMFTLYDMSNLPLQVLTARDSGCFSSRKMKFPNTDMVLSVKATMYYDRALYYKTINMHQIKLETDFNNNRWNIDFKEPAVIEWNKNNPKPEPNDREFNYIKCHFSLPTGIKSIVMTKEEIETSITESILLGVNDEE